VSKVYVFQQTASNHEYQFSNNRTVYIRTSLQEPKCIHGQCILINHLYIFIEDYVYGKICGRNSQSQTCSRS